MSEQYSLQNKQVIIFGGSSGLGFATAKAALAEGAKVIIASSSEDKVNKAVNELKDAKGYVVDVTKEEAIKLFFDNVGRFDHLIYTAGENIASALIQDADVAASQMFLQIRFWGVFAAIKYGSPYINPGGSISLMSGSFGQRPARGYGLGAAICGAMDAFTRAMAVELAPIRVNNVAAGVTKTAMWNGMNEADRNSFFDYVENAVLLKRVGEAEDIALAFIYLMKQTYTTGQSVVVDGGSVLV